MISIRKHLERLAGEDKVRGAYRRMIEAILNTTRENLLVADAEEHSWFSSSLESFMMKLREDPSITNVEVVSALVTRTLADHYGKLARQTESRETELKRIINLLTETAARLDRENRQFYLDLRHAVQTFQTISQIEDITYLRKKLSEQVTHLQESAGRQEAASGGLVAQLQAELEAARKEIEVLSQSVTEDALTQLPTRRVGEKTIRELVEGDVPFSVAMAIIERLDLINLRHGPLVGDSVLRRFSTTLRNELPPRAFLCRWGGPAFVALVEHLPAADLKASVQKILAGIASQPVKAEGRAAGLFHITSRYAVHQWLSGQTPEKVISLINVFCLAQKTEESSEASLSVSP
jgi:diguanylate cyclase (GGDEF)-like protein